MHFKKPAVTLFDKKKAKKTIKVFGFLAAVFLVLTTITAILTPRAKTLKGIDNNIDKTFENAISIKYGKEYVIFSREIMQRYDVETNKFIDEYNYTGEIKELASTYNVDLSNGFTDQVIHYTNIDENNGYFLCFDVYGDIFRIDFTNDKFILSNKCFLTDRCSIKINNEDTVMANSYRIRNVFIKDSICYTLALNNNTFVINTFDVNHLDSGIKNFRNIYRYNKPNKNQKKEIATNYEDRIDPMGTLDYDLTPYYIADPLINTSGSGENPFTIFEEDGKIYVLTSLGIYTYSSDFNDFNEFNFTNKAKQLYIEKERADLLSKTKEELLERGISLELQSTLSTASDFIIDTVFKYVYDNGYASKIKGFAKEIVLDEANKSWLAYYNPNVYNLSMVVFASAAETSFNRYIDKGADYTLAGMAYSPVQKAIYIINFLDSTLYYLKTNKLNSVDFNTTKTLNSFATKTNVVFKGKGFFENHGAISYDRVGDSLHVLFENDRDLCIIDIKDDDIKVRASFSAQYDISGFDENRTGDKLIVTYKTNRVTIKNEVTSPYQVDIIDPSTYQYRSLFIIFTIVFAALVLVAVVFILISARTLKSDKAMLKSKVIKKDFKRNKWTYVALIPFVVLLILFCYVEAVGSISFSFFSYTADHPTYIWNNFGNYIQIFNDPDFWLMFGNTFFFLLFDLILGLIPPIIFAFCLSIIKRKKLSGVLRALMFVPAVVPGIASLLIWRFGIFGDAGVLNSLVCLLRFGSTSHPAYEPIKFLADSSISRWSLLLIGFPYVGGYLIFYGGLMNVPNEYHEACKLEGLGAVKTFFKVDLPLIKPQMKYILVITILNSAQNYERTYMLGSTGTTTLVESMYRQMKDYTNYGRASAYATIIFLLLLIPVLINFRDTKKSNLGDQI